MEPTKAYGTALAAGCKNLAFVGVADEIRRVYLIGENRSCVASVLAETILLCIHSRCMDQIDVSELDSFDDAPSYQPHRYSSAISGKSLNQTFESREIPKPPSGMKDLLGSRCIFRSVLAWIHGIQIIKTKQAIKEEKLTSTLLQESQQVARISRYCRCSA